MGKSLINYNNQSFWIDDAVYRVIIFEMLNIFDDDLAKNSLPEDQTAWLKSYRENLFDYLTSTVMNGALDLVLEDLVDKKKPTALYYKLLKNSQINFIRQR